MATSASIYNQQRTVRQILKRHRKEPPSLVLHINNGHFHFAGQVGLFNWRRMPPENSFADMASPLHRCLGWHLSL